VSYNKRGDAQPSQKRRGRLRPCTQKPRLVGPDRSMSAMTLPAQPVPTPTASSPVLSCKSFVTACPPRTTLRMPLRQLLRSAQSGCFRPVGPSRTRQFLQGALRRPRRPDGEPLQSRQLRQSGRFAVPSRAATMSATGPLGVLTDGGVRVRWMGPISDRAQTVEEM
jgi:hypothetical protein